MVELCEALQAMKEERIDPKVTSEAKSLENNLTSFDLIVSLVAVSYTHLDVYKRQPKKVPVFCLASDKYVNFVQLL